MKNIKNWTPTKFDLKKGILKASKRSNHLSLSSRIFANSIANFYTNNIPQFIKGRIVDLGCGKVPFYGFYKDYITENICIDWDNNEIENPFLDLKQDLNLKLNFEDNEFDSIILSDVLEHIRKPDLLMGEMYRILKPQGTVIFNVPFFYWIHEEPYDYYRYTEYALKLMAEDAGFTVVKIETLGGIPEVLGDLLSKIIVRLPLIGLSLTKIIQLMILSFLKTKTGQIISKKSAKKFPIGYGIILKKE